MIWLFLYHIPYQPSTNIIPRAKALGMILVSMFFQYYICKFPLFSTKYMINVYIWNTFVSNLLHSVKFLKCLSITSRDCHGILGNMFRFDGQWLTIIPLKMILITWLEVHNTEQDFLMFKYMINIIWYGSFCITSRINPRAKAFWRCWCYLI
jgi:hypothetical protein